MWIGSEVISNAIDRHIVDPDGTWRIGAFRHIEQTKAIKRSAIGPVCGVDVRDNG
jgi:hypothetical protein